MSAEKFLVTGATGRAGRDTVQRLVEKGHAVRALVHREDERSEALRGTGAEVVVGDLLERRRHPSNCPDQRRLFLLSGPPRAHRSDGLVRGRGQAGRSRGRGQPVADIRPREFQEPRNRGAEAKPVKRTAVLPEPSKCLIDAIAPD
jgi:uncharacterized protein YbjT (DUF2867 family)